MTSRSHGMIDLGNIHAPIGSQPWCVAVHTEASTQKRNGQNAIGSLKLHLRWLFEGSHYKALTDENGVPFLLWEDYVQYREPFGLGMRADVAQAILAETDDRTLIRDIVQRTVERVQETPEAAPHGGDRRSDKAKQDQGDIITLKERGTSADYLAARIKRDRPDIAARTEAGEFRSVRAAAKAAGIIKEPTWRDRMRKLWAKGTPEDRTWFLTEISE